VNTLPGFGAIPGSKPRISISDRDGSLIITIVEKEDMGWYTCRPSNGVGQDPEAGAYLNITCKLTQTRSKVMTLEFGGHSPCLESDFL
jgi:hypothetical protein